MYVNSSLYCWLSSWALRILLSFFESLVATLICVFLNIKFTIIKVFVYHHRLSTTNWIKKTRLSLYCYKMVNKPHSLFLFWYSCHGCHLTNMSHLFWIVYIISCKIARGSRKFKFFHKIPVIHEKFLVLLKLRRGPDKTR